MSFEDFLALLILIEGSETTTRQNFPLFERILLALKPSDFSFEKVPGGYRVHSSEDRLFVGPDVAGGVRYLDEAVSCFSGCSKQNQSHETHCV